MLFHPLQRKFFDITVGRTSALFGMSSIGLKEDGYLDNRLTTGNLEFEILLTPGHSLDSICFYCKKEKIMICGDVVFSGSTGRVDLPGGNAEELKKSIEMIAKLDIEYLLPGHMDIIEGKERVKKNFEFVRKVVFPWL
jgi:glyoxylase-like metal-dependent hydrolase (beta-lactamase superfamily II)